MNRVRGSAGGVRLGRKTAAGQPGHRNPALRTRALQLPRLARGCTPNVIYQRSPSRVSKRGLRREAMASRARKMRDRTVPMGQFITSEISS